VGRVVVDLAGCSGTEQPYVMVLRSTSLEGLFVLRVFNFDQITKRRSEDLQKEFSRLEGLKLSTIVKYDSGAEAKDTKRLLVELRGKGSTGQKRKPTGTIDVRTPKKRAET